MREVSFLLSEKFSLLREQERFFSVGLLEIAHQLLRELHFFANFLLIFARRAFHACDVLDTIDRRRDSLNFVSPHSTMSPSIPHSTSHDIAPSGHALAHHSMNHAADPPTAPSAYRDCRSFRLNALYISGI